MAAKRTTKKLITPYQRERMIDQLAQDFIDAEMDDGPRGTLYEYIVEGSKGLKDYSDKELYDEYVEAYGKSTFNKLPKE